MVDISGELVVGIALFLTITSNSVLANYHDRGRPMSCIGPCVKGVDRLLMPACPAMRLPGDVLHICPGHRSFAKGELGNLPIIISEREKCDPFDVRPFRNKSTPRCVSCRCSGRGMAPCLCRMYLRGVKTSMHFTPSRRSTVCRVRFMNSNAPRLIMGSGGNSLAMSNGTISKCRRLNRCTAGTCVCV